MPSLLKIKNRELVVPWSIEPTNTSSELPISLLLPDEPEFVERVLETVTKSDISYLNILRTRRDAFICYLLSGRGLGAHPGCSFWPRAAVDTRQNKLIRLSRMRCTSLHVFSEAARGSSTPSSCRWRGWNRRSPEILACGTGKLIARWSHTSGEQLQL